MTLHGIKYYGKLRDDSNFELIFEDEYFDHIWTDGNTNTGKPFQTWKEAVTFFKNRARTQGAILLEISTC